jgi:hypothetical protein
MPELPDIAGILPVYESQRSLTILTEEPNPWMLFQWPRLVGYNGLWTYCYAPAGFLGGHYRINRNQGGAAVMHPGTLEGNKMLFEAAEKQGVFLNMHLGQLLRLAFADSDYDSFTEGMHHSYCGEYIPFKPSKDELEHIAGAVKKALPVLAKYKSLRDIALADNPQWPNVWSARNIEDFNAATGEKLAVSPFYLENAHTILQGGAALVKKWSQWACGERFKFHKWLLDELKKYRSDLYITLSRNWYWGLVSRFESAEPVWGATRERLAALGIKDYDDYLRFMGTDPELYKGNPGVSLELEAGAELRNGVKDVQIIPDYYQKDWFKRIKSCFSAGGLSIMRNYCYDECSKPLSVWTVNFFANQENTAGDS